MTDCNAKMSQIRFRLGLRPRPRWGSLIQRSPDPLAGFGGRFAARPQGKGLGWGRGGKGGGEAEGGGSGVEGN